MKDELVRVAVAMAAKDLSINHIMQANNARNCEKLDFYMCFSLLTCRILFVVLVFEYVAFLRIYSYY